MDATNDSTCQPCPARWASCECLAVLDALTAQMVALTSELRRVNNIIRTECAIDDECEDVDREWEVNPSDALTLCHQAYDLLWEHRGSLFAQVIGAGECDTARAARGCYEALEGLRWPLLSPNDGERPMGLLKRRLGLDR